MTKLGAMQVALMGVLAGALLAPRGALAQSNPVVVENALPGNPDSDWDVSGAGDPSIQGFATDIGVNRGDTISFKIDTPSADYRLDIYRMGYYGGMGARLVASILPSATLPQTQPVCLTDGTGITDCGNWAVSASWAVPSNATSGIYFAKLVRQDAVGASHVVFVVRDDSSHSKLLFQTSDTTWQAYNQYGGNSLYVGASEAGSPAGRAFRVSYNRPFTTRDATPEDWVFNAEYPMVRWLEANGYDVTYTTGMDADRRGDKILQHTAYLSVGHDEYWSGTQRANVEAARSAGVALAFFSGNEVFWKTRWETSIDGSATPYRTLTCYKETHANAVIDPADPPTWTGTWRDPRFSPPADGGRPENGLTGTIFTVNCCSYNITVPADDGKMRFWRNTSIASLPPAGSATLPNETLGYEWDEDLDNGRDRASLHHAAESAAAHSRLRIELRPGHGDPSPDALSRCWRRARLRSRHGAVVVGTRRQPRSRQRSARREHAAGHGQPVGRHGCAAGDVAGGPGGRDGLDRYDPAVVDGYVADRRLHRDQRLGGDDQRHRQRHRRRSRRRRRSVRRWRGDLASGRRA